MGINDFVDGNGIYAIDGVLTIRAFGEKDRGDFWELNH